MVSRICPGPSGPPARLTFRNAPPPARTRAGCRTVSPPRPEPPPPAPADRRSCRRDSPAPARDGSRSPPRLRPDRGIPWETLRARRDIPPSVRALEPAVPITEVTVLRGERAALEGGPIETDDAHERLGDLLSVRAHVLYRRAADRPGDARQALDAGPAACHGALDQGVPIDSGAGADLGALPVTELHPAD